MKPILACFTACALFLFLLAGCASTKENEGQDPAAIKVVMSTDPSPAAVGKNVHITAAFTGLNSTDGAEVQFDFREPNARALPALVNATLDKDGTYKADHTFKVPGTYKVYVHFYQDDLHISKKSQLVVEQ